MTRKSTRSSSKSPKSPQTNWASELTEGCGILKCKNTNLEISYSILSGLQSISVWHRSGRPQGRVHENVHSIAVPTWGYRIPAAGDAVLGCWGRGFSPKISDLQIFSNVFQRIQFQVNRMQMIRRSLDTVSGNDPLGQTRVGPGPIDLMREPSGMGGMPPPLIRATGGQERRRDDRGEDRYCIPNGSLTLTRDTIYQCYSQDRLIFLVKANSDMLITNISGLKMLSVHPNPRI